jgi:hypothetical protein
MGKTGEQFLQLREINALSYDHSFTKKEAIKTGTELAKNIIDGGEVDLFQVIGNLSRLSEVVGAALSQLKQADYLFDNIDKGGYNMNGVNFSLSNTGDRQDYEADPVYKDLAKKLKDREALLKQALKSDTELFAAAYDPETGEEVAMAVPKVPVKTFGKTVIKIQY